MEQVKEGTLTEEEALLRIPANQMDFFLHPTLDPKAEKVERVDAKVRKTHTRPRLFP